MKTQPLLLSMLWGLCLWTNGCAPAPEPMAQPAELHTIKTVQLADESQTPPLTMGKDQVQWEQACPNTSP